FWLEGPLEVALPDGTAVVDLRIRGSDVDPEQRGRAMRIAYWNGALDGERSTGAYHRRTGKLSGGGGLYFEKGGARTEILLSLELDGAPAPARPSGFYAIRRATLKKGQPPCRAVVVDEAHRFCILEEQPDQPGWQLIRGRLTIGDTVVEIAS